MGVGLRLLAWCLGLVRSLDWSCVSSPDRLPWQDEYMEWCRTNPVENGYETWYAGTGGPCGSCHCCQRVQAVEGCTPVLEDPPESARSYSSVAAADVDSSLNSAGGWRPHVDQAGEWLQIDLGEVKSVRGLATKGGTSGYISTYFVSYSIDLASWSDMGETFEAFEYYETFLQTLFPAVFSFRYLRIVVDSFSSPIQFGVGVLLCDACQAVEENPSEDQRSYSVVSPGLNQSMLDLSAGWGPDADSSGHWMQMDLGSVRRVQGIVTQATPSTKTQECRREIDGGQWTLVRHNKGSGGWGPWNDNLAGTATQGTPGTESSTYDWTVTWDSTSVWQFLFAFGDCSHWLIAEPEQVVGQNYADETRWIVKSSVSAEPYQARWYYRSGSPEDPWVSTRDNINSKDSSLGATLYGEASREHRISKKNAHGGSNVYIRSSRPEEVACLESIVGYTYAKALPDEKITASSYWGNDPGHGLGQMWRSRLDNMETSWCPGSNDENQYLQWDFDTPLYVSGVQTKGRANLDRWVPEYKISYTVDGNAWTQLSGVFQGNTDRDTVQFQPLAPPILATAVRLHPVSWFNGICMRVDLLGCETPPEEVVTWLDLKGKTATQSSTHGHALNPIASKAIDGNHNTSFYSGSCSATLQEANPWWQVDLGRAYSILHVRVTNRGDCCSDRLSPFDVYVDNQPCAQGVAIGNEVKEVRCRAQGQVVKLLVQKPSIALHFCEFEVGVEEQDIVVNPPEQRRSYSSIVFNDDIGTGHARSRLDSPLAWCGSGWMEIDLGFKQQVRGVVTQGRADNPWVFQHVTKFKLSFSIDGLAYSRLDDVFTSGRSDNGKRYSNMLSEAVPARYVRFNVEQWNGNNSACMRAGVLCAIDEASVAGKVFATGQGWLSYPTRDANDAVTDAWTALYEGDMTWECWCKISAAAVVHTRNNIMTTYGPNHNTDTYSTSSRRRSIGVYVESTGQFSIGAAVGGTFSETWSNVKTEQSYADNQWHHVTAVWSRSAQAAELWVDSVLVATIPSYNPGSENPGLDGQLVIGGGHDGRETNCQVAGLRLWRRALSGSEIALLSERTSACPAHDAPGLEAVYLVDGFRNLLANGHPDLQALHGGAFVNEACCCIVHASYHVAFSNDASSWTLLENQPNSFSVVPSSSNERHIAVLPEMLEFRYLRILPQWSLFAISMRAGLLVCLPTTTTTTTISTTSITSTISTTTTSTITTTTSTTSTTTSSSTSTTSTSTTSTTTTSTTTTTTTSTTSTTITSSTSTTSTSTTSTTTKSTTTTTSTTSSTTSATSTTSTSTVSTTTTSTTTTSSTSSTNTSTTSTTTTSSTTTSSTSSTTTTTSSTTSTTSTPTTTTSSTSTSTTSATSSTTTSTSTSTSSTTTTLGLPPSLAEVVARVCADSVSFVDARGLACSDWAGLNCSEGAGYREGDLEELQQNCPVSCGECAGPAPAPPPLVAQPVQKVDFGMSITLDLGGISEEERISVLKGSTAAALSVSEDSFANFSVSEVPASGQQQASLPSYAVRAEVVTPPSTTTRNLVLRARSLADPQSSASTSFTGAMATDYGVDTSTMQMAVTESPVAETIMAVIDSSGQLVVAASRDAGAGGTGVISNDCGDTTSFVDEQGEGCSGWVGYDCYNLKWLRTDKPYTAAGLVAVQLACGLSCGFCSPPSRNKTKDLLAGCVDDAFVGEFCLRWRGLNCSLASDLGFDDRYVQVLMERCPLSCGQCNDGTPPCGDLPGYVDEQFNSCESWQNHDCTKMFAGYTRRGLLQVQALCPASCGLCGGSSTGAAAAAVAVRGGETGRSLEGGRPCEDNLGFSYLHTFGCSMFIGRFCNYGTLYLEPRWLLGPRGIAKFHERLWQNCPLTCGRCSPDDRPSARDLFLECEDDPYLARWCAYTWEGHDCTMWNRSVNLVLEGEADRFRSTLFAACPDTCRLCTPPSCDRGLRRDRSRHVCLECEPGRFAASLRTGAAAARCTGARPGFAVPSAGASFQEPCSVGAFSATAEQRNCSLCAPGRFAVSRGVFHSQLARDIMVLPLIPWANMFILGSLYYARGTTLRLPLVLNAIANIYSGLFVNLSLMTGQLFITEEMPNGKLFLKSAPGIEYGSEEWWLATPFSIGGVTIYCCGFLAYSIHAAYVAPRRIVEDRFGEQYGFLLDDMQPCCFWWGPVVLLFDFCISMVQSLSSNVFMQIHVSAVISLGFLTLQWIFKPYIHMVVNSVCAALNFSLMIFVIFMTAFVEVEKLNMEPQRHPFKIIVPGILGIAATACFIKVIGALYSRFMRSTELDLKVDVMSRDIIDTMQGCSTEEVLARLTDMVEPELKLLEEFRSMTAAVFFRQQAGKHLHQQRVLTSDEWKVFRQTLLGIEVQRAVWTGDYQYWRSEDRKVQEKIEKLAIALFHGPPLEATRGAAAGSSLLVQHARRCSAHRGNLAGFVRHATPELPAPVAGHAMRLVGNRARRSITSVRTRYGMAELDEDSFADDLSSLGTGLSDRELRQVFAALSFREVASGQHGGDNGDKRDDKVKLRALSFREIANGEYGDDDDDEERDVKVKVYDLVQRLKVLSRRAGINHSSFRSDELDMGINHGSLGSDEVDMGSRDEEGSSSVVSTLDGEESAVSPFVPPRGSSGRRRRRSDPGDYEAGSVRDEEEENVVSPFVLPRGSSDRRRRRSDPGDCEAGSVRDEEEDSAVSPFVLPRGSSDRRRRRSDPGDYEDSAGDAELHSLAEVVAQSSPEPSFDRICKNLSLPKDRWLLPILPGQPAPVHLSSASADPLRASQQRSIWG